MQFYDVCNGDADGLIARHQFRLSFPVLPSRLTLITGAKREIALLSRVNVHDVANNGAANDRPNDTAINVFDISYDQNAESAQRLLEAGAAIRYFDHHRASQLQPHPQLEVHIDTSAHICTSLIVDRYLNAGHRPWAIAAAFGDNLTKVAEQLAVDAKMSAAQTRLLRQLGECINYNAYGETCSDLHFPPEEIARRMMPYQSPFEFAQCEDILPRLQNGFAADLHLAQSVLPLHASKAVTAYVLPDEPWARRISGTFANMLVRTNPQRAHAVLSLSADSTYTVSIRAPLDNPQHADAVAIQFINGGGRAAAAGINNLATHEITRLVSLLEATYGVVAG